MIIALIILCILNALLLVLLGGASLVHAEDKRNIEDSKNGLKELYDRAFAEGIKTGKIEAFSSFIDCVMPFVEEVKKGLDAEAD